MELFHSAQEYLNVTKEQAQAALRVFELLGLKPLRWGVLDPNGWGMKFVPAASIVGAEAQEKAHYAAFFPGPAFEQWRSLGDTWGPLDQAVRTNFPFEAFLMQESFKNMSLFPGTPATIEKVLFDRYKSAIVEQAKKFVTTGA